MQQRDERLNDEVALKRDVLTYILFLASACFVIFLIKKIWLPGAVRFLPTFLCCVVAVPQTERILRFRSERVHFIPYQRVLDLHGHFRWRLVKDKDAAVVDAAWVGERQLCCSSTSASSCACRSVLLVPVEMDAESSGAGPSKSLL